MSQATTSSQQPQANDRQVGGTHYKSKIQHWDYVIANGLGYFEGQITKYVTRWRNKNGLEDLYKGRHFLDKLIETEEARLEAAQQGHHESCDQMTDVGSVRSIVQQNGHEVVVGATKITDLDAYSAEAATARALAYANRRPNSNVPEGWVLEPTVDNCGWHFRAGNGGLWSLLYVSREEALAALLQRIKNDL